MTLRLTLAKVRAYIERTFSAEEARAARTYFVDGHNCEELAAQLGLAASTDAEQLIRRLNPLALSLPHTGELTGRWNRLVR